MSIPFSVPTPLYYNQDSVPDLLIRTNLGVWHDYNISTLRLLDGRNGAEIWAFDSAHFGMMSSLSLASKSPGSDAMLFMTIGTPDANTDPSMYDDTGVRYRVHRSDDRENAYLVNINDFDGEAEEMGDDIDEHHGNHCPSLSLSRSLSSLSLSPSPICPLTHYVSICRRCC